MIRVILGIFLILHGLVHLLYFALSRKLFDLDPPLTGWPEGSKVLSGFLSNTTTNAIASVLYAAATIVFVISGVGVLADLSWWRVALIVAAVLSSATVFLFWDGTMQRLPDKGFVGVLINIALIGVLFAIERLVITL